MKKLTLALMLACLFAPASTSAQNAYITNKVPNTVSVIDTATDTVIATIPVGLGPIGVAVKEGLRHPPVRQCRIGDRHCGQRHESPSPSASSATAWR